MISRKPSHASLQSNHVEPDAHPLADPGPVQPTDMPYKVYHTRVPSKALTSPNNATFAPAATITAPQPSSSAPSGPTASAKLHFQTLQATVQTAGLTNNSAGWMLLLNLINGPAVEGKGKDKESPEQEQWERLFRLLEEQHGPYQIALLLPQETSSQQAVSSAFMASHTILCAPVDSNGAQRIVTLSGLRGIIENNHLHFSSCVPTKTNADYGSLGYQEDLMGDGLFDSRTTSFPTSLLSPLKHKLSVPRHAPAKDGKQKLGAKTGNPGATSRLASLFGGKEAQTKELPPMVTTPSVEDLGHPQFFDSLDASPLPSLDLKVYVLEKSLKLTEQRRLIKRAYEAHIRSNMAQQLDPLNEQVVWQDATPHVVQFVKSFYPPSSDWKPPTSLNRFFEPPSPGWMDHVAIAAQDTYIKVRESVSLKDEAESQNQTELVDAVLEVAETIICDTLYDRLFALSGVGDKGQDLALAARIAGLNLLQLTLEHLGLDIGDEPEVPTPDLHILQSNLNRLVKDCGAELKRLEDPTLRSPKAKLDVLIKAHQIIVDRLSSMPPVPMKKEVRSPSGPARPSGTYEMTDDVKSLASRNSSEPGSPQDRTPSLHASNSLEVPAIHLSEPALNDLKDASSEQSEKGRPSSSSADLILPLLIYSVVQVSPSNLASHLAFIQRFRAEDLFRGEAAYCLVNMQAVMEFLLTVDLNALGLGEDRILPPEQDTARPEALRARANVRGKVSQELDSIAGHVSNTISGVAGVMGMVLAKTVAASPGPKTIDEVRNVLGSSDHKPDPPTQNFGASLLKRASTPLNKTTDSIRSRSRSLFGGSVEPPKEKELVDVAPSEEKDFDASSITSDQSGKPTIANRLASLARFSGKEDGGAKDGRALFGGFSPSTSSRTRSRSSSIATNSPPPTRPVSVISSEAPALDGPPNERFLTATADDLRVSEIPGLLQDYKRLAALLASRAPKPAN